MKAHMRAALGHMVAKRHVSVVSKRQKYLQYVAERREVAHKRAMQARLTEFMKPVKRRKGPPRWKGGPRQTNSSSGHGRQRSRSAATEGNSAPLEEEETKEDETVLIRRKGSVPCLEPLSARSEPDTGEPDSGRQGELTARSGATTGRTPRTARTAEGETSARSLRSTQGESTHRSMRSGESDLDHPAGEPYELEKDRRPYNMQSKIDTHSPYNVPPLRLKALGDLEDKMRDLSPRGGHVLAPPAPNEILYRHTARSARSAKLMAERSGANTERTIATAPNAKDLKTAKLGTTDRSMKSINSSRSAKGTVTGRRRRDNAAVVGPGEESGEEADGGSAGDESPEEAGSLDAGQAKPPRHSARSQRSQRSSRSHKHARSESRTACTDLTAETAEQGAETGRNYDEMDEGTSRSQISEEEEARRAQLEEEAAARRAELDEQIRLVELERAQLKEQMHLVEVERQKQINVAKAEADAQETIRHALAATQEAEAALTYINTVVATPRQPALVEGGIITPRLELKMVEHFPMPDKEEAAELVEEDRDMQSLYEFPQSPSPPTAPPVDSLFEQDTAVPPPLIPKPAEPVKQPTEMEKAVEDAKQRYDMMMTQYAATIQDAKRQLSVLKPALGMQIRDEEYEGTQAGLRVVHLLDGSAADTAGVMMQDLLITIEGAEMLTCDDFFDIFDTKKPGDILHVELMRQDVSLSLMLMVGGRVAGAKMALSMPELARLMKLAVADPKVPPVPETHESFAERAANEATQAAMEVIEMSYQAKAERAARLQHKKEMEALDRVQGKFSRQARIAKAKIAFERKIIRIQALYRGNMGRRKFRDVAREYMARKAEEEARAEVEAAEERARRTIQMLKDAEHESVKKRRQDVHDMIAERTAAHKEQQEARFIYDRWKPALGMQFRDNPDEEQGGVLVVMVLKNSAAAYAGVLEGDVILNANGCALEVCDDFFEIFRHMSPGDIMNLSLVRNELPMVMMLMVGAANVTMPELKRIKNIATADTVVVPDFDEVTAEDVREEKRREQVIRRAIIRKERERRIAQEEKRNKDLAAELKRKLAVMQSVEGEDDFFGFPEDVTPSPKRREEGAAVQPTAQQEKMQQETLVQQEMALAQQELPLEEQSLEQNMASTLAQLKAERSKREAEADELKREKRRSLLDADQQIATASWAARTVEEVTLPQPPSTKAPREAHSEYEEALVATTTEERQHQQQEFDNIKNQTLTRGRRERQKVLGFVQAMRNPDPLQRPTSMADAQFAALDARASSSQADPRRVSIERPQKVKVRKDAVDDSPAPASDEADEPATSQPAAAAGTAEPTRAAAEQAQESSAPSKAVVRNPDGEGMLAVSCRKLPIEGMSHVLVGLYARSNVEGEQFDSVSQTERLQQDAGDPNFGAPLDVRPIMSQRDTTLMFVVYGAGEEEDVSTDDMIGSCTISLGQVMDATSSASCKPMQLALVTASGTPPGDAYLLLQSLANLPEGFISPDEMDGQHFTAEGQDERQSVQAAAKAIYNFFATRQCVLFPDKGSIEVSWELLHSVVEAGGGPEVALTKVQKLNDDRRQFKDLRDLASALSGKEQAPVAMSQQDMESVYNQLRQTRLLVDEEAMGNVVVDDMTELVAEGQGLRGTLARLTLLSGLPEKYEDLKALAKAIAVVPNSDSRLVAILAAQDGAAKPTSKAAELAPRKDMEQVYSALGETSLLSETDTAQLKVTWPLLSALVNAKPAKEQTIRALQHLDRDGRKFSSIAEIIAGVRSVP